MKIEVNNTYQQPLCRVLLLDEEVFLLASTNADDFDAITSPESNWTNIFK